MPAQWLKDLNANDNQYIFLSLMCADDAVRVQTIKFSTSSIRLMTLPDAEATHALLDSVAIYRKIKHIWQEHSKHFKNTCHTGYEICSQFFNNFLVYVKIISPLLHFYSCHSAVIEKTWL